MIKKLARFLTESGSIVFLGGAGVSTASGIPDFRSESGLYKAEREYGYPPEQLLSHTFFMTEPKIFYRYYKANLLHLAAEPNAAHIALAALEKLGRLSAVVTQNIDELHQNAGSATIFELHGSVYRNYCMACGERYGVEYILDEASCVEGVPKCLKCGGTVRPDVTLYGEQLDQTVLSDATAAVRRADTLIVGGTSLAVYPAAGLVDYYRGERLVVINKSPTPADSAADLVIHDDIGRVLAEAVELL